MASHLIEAPPPTLPRMPRGNPDIAKHAFKPGDERAAAAGRKGAATRRANAAAKRSATLDAASSIAILRTAYERETVGDLARLIVVDTLARIGKGEIPIRHAADAAELIRTLVDIARVEEGKATSITATLTGADLVGKLREAQQLVDGARTAGEITHAPTHLSPGPVLDVPSEEYPPPEEPTHHA